MKNIFHHSLFILLLLSFSSAALLGLAGCSTQKNLTGSDQQAVLAYSESITDNLMQGFNNQDYTTFSKDFDAQMLEGITSDSFTSSLIPTIQGKLGKYISRQVTSVTQIGADVLIVYTAKFEQDDAVTVRVTFTSSTPHQVAGLYFNSAKLSA